jgi:hypothetical protein
MNKEPIMELNELWTPVRPYLARYVGEVYGRCDGSVLEAGPFSGLVFELARARIGRIFHIAAFPTAIIGGLEEEARELGVDDRVSVMESNENLAGIQPESYDLAVFRGAFFFPSFFIADLKAIHRALKVGGIALLGGGFGPYTPDDVIGVMESRSRHLNEVLGRVRITEDDLWRTVASSGLRAQTTMVSSGGLWVVIRKEADT